MGIIATCQCGARFSANVGLAGKTVKCPTCGQALQVPNSAAAAKPATFQCACSCGRTYSVPTKMAGQTVRCNACSQQFVVPPAPGSAVQPSAVSLTSPPSDPFAGTDPLADLGDLSSFGGPPGGAVAGANVPVRAPATVRSGTRETQRPRKKKKGINQTVIISIVCGSVAVLAMIGIIVAAFVFFPFGSRYATPEAVWEAQRKATEDKDWRTLYRTLTPETRVRMVSGIAFMAQMIASNDDGMRAIASKHGLKGPASAPDMASPAGMGQMFAKMQEQMDQAAASIDDKEAFFVDAMDYLAEKGEEMRGKMGNQQATLMTASQELKEVVVDGDSARGIQTISAMGTTIDAPIEFRRIDNSWLIHQPG